MERNKSMKCTIIKMPYGFKIRKKDDVDVFINDCMCNDNRYSVVNENGTQIIIEKDKDGNVSVCLRTGDLNDIFNPSLEVARTKDNCYKETVQDYIWKFRKAINKEWFDEGRRG